ncbi:M56 family metallopeptidase [Aliikangiella maris]|uniref:M56 family metallopeptidase n=2 Tax=Aliikangiella maris TaxID=3162458 RepID=A0ABV3MQM5_9GAMM
MTPLLAFIMMKGLGLSLLILLLGIFRKAIARWLTPKVAYQVWWVIPVYLCVPAHWGIWHSAPLNESMMTFWAQLSLQQEGFSINQSNTVSFFVEWWVLIWSAGAAITFSLFVFRYDVLKRSFSNLSNTAVSTLVEKVAVEILSDNEDFSDQHKSKLTTNKHSKTRLKSLKIVHSHLLSMPAVVGIINTYLILPKNFSEYSPKQQRIILSHELMHIRHGDLRWNLLKMIIKILFWFNPLVYWGEKQFEAAQEVACDYRVMQKIGLTEAGYYGRALVNAISGSHTHPLISHWKNQSLLKERLNMLKSKSTKTRHTVLGLLFGAVTLTCVSGFSIAEVEDSHIIPVNIVNPSYPRSAAENNIEGYVQFEYSIDHDGNPYDLKVLQSVPAGVFDEAAFAALKQWKFPAKEEFNVRYTMQFVMQ